MTYIKAIVITIIILSLIYTASAINVPSCDTCHEEQHLNCGNCHDEYHHENYPYKNCFDCHGDSVELHHSDTSNCICHEIHTIQLIPHLPERWRNCNNCHEVDHHKKGAEERCSTCHTDDDSDENCEKCHRKFPNFDRNWDDCDNCHSSNKHSNCNSCHSDVDHHDDVKGQCSNCHETKKTESDEPSPTTGKGTQQGKQTEEPDIIIINEKDEDKCIISLRSPALGLGWKGSVYGDSIPILYTWVDEQCVMHTTDYHPSDGEYISGVLVTPAQIAGVPIQNYSYKDSAKYKRLLLWKSNSQT